MLHHLGNTVMTCGLVKLGLECLMPAFAARRGRNAGSPGVTSIIPWQVDPVSNLQTAAVSAVYASIFVRFYKAETNAM